MRIVLVVLAIMLLSFGAWAESDEPFGVATVPDPTNPYGENWHKVQKDWVIERGMLDQCRAGREFCAPAALHFLAIVDEARLQAGRIRIAYVNRAINLTIRPKDDVSNYGVAEIWAAPLATLANGSGDCTDYAIAKYYSLGEIGIPEDDRRLVIVRTKNPLEYHAVLAVREDRRWLILDNRTLAIMDAKDTDYAPVFEFDRRGMHRFVKSKIVVGAACTGRG